MLFVLLARVMHCFTTFTYRAVKVCQAELSGFREELSLVHEANVENDVGSFPDVCAIDVVVLQSLTHREVNHRVKPQTLTDETLHHF